jgi:plasmid rolling circle replication initiator protein Rep
MWQARFYESLPRLVCEYPKARWIFLTLTVRNCEIAELRKTIQHMNQSWMRLTKRKEFKIVTGWVRTTEVTRGDDDSAHPHFHVLAMVPPSYFGVGYVSHARWTELWRSCLGVSYTPIVNVKVVRPKLHEQDKIQHAVNTIEALQAAVQETLKYSVKPSDMTGGDDDGEWFLELTRQTHKLRFISTGGALKNVLKINQESDQDLCLVDSHEPGSDSIPIQFVWEAFIRKYHR